MYEINKRIREEMERQNITMTDLANMSGLSRSTISRYVSDKIEPKQNAVGAIAKSLGVPLPWLLFGVDIYTTSDSFFEDYKALNEINKAMARAYVKALLDGQATKTPAPADAQ